MKKYLIAFSVMMISGVAGAADSASRVDCTAIQARINELVAIEEPSAEQSTELAQLQAQYRADCSRSAAGRRATTTSRISVATVAAASTPVAATPQVETVVVTTRTVLDEYLNGNIKKGEVKEVSIEWQWKYETNESGDMQDTKDGNELKEYNFLIIARGEEKI